MREIVNINFGWVFVKSNESLENLSFEKGEKINIPHTWNNLDGQDGGNNYYRGTCWYLKKLDASLFDSKKVNYLEFKGVNSSAKVYLNGKLVKEHHGGYSTFRCNISDFLSFDKENILAVAVDNSENDFVYPQKADFTFYGGIYRDVNVIKVDQNHFDLDYYGSLGIKATPKIDGDKGILDVRAYVVGEGQVVVSLYDKENNKVELKEAGNTYVFDNVRLWNGRSDPYLYKLSVELIKDNKVVDNVAQNIGFRTFHVDPKKGFYLNGKQYKLRGVCRHQDRKDIGNALLKEHHEEDIDMIFDIGANTIRLAHYQQDDYILDLCDKYGFIVWVEIPYISKHMNNGRANLISQMKELIYQQYNHPSIVVWGISNEITMFKGFKKEAIEDNKMLNDLCHEIDPTRLTTMACFAMCGPFNKIAKITDVVSWNLYFGWYVPFKVLNKLWFGFYHFTHPKRCVGLSEYGAEAMLNLHSNSPRVGDSTEDYQASYHEYMLRFFAKRDYLWATHIWNMFDFGSDGRNHGGDPGVNHKGLVDFTHKIKKDSYYICKAYWSDDPFVYITGKRFKNRNKKSFILKIYSNKDSVDLFVNDSFIKNLKVKNHVAKYKVKFDGDTLNIKVTSENLIDSAIFKKVDKFDENYKLHSQSNNYSWEK